jgi:hypothetical protein
MQGIVNQNCEATLPIVLKQGDRLGGIEFVDRI